jgi:hypothetical protein
MLALLLFLLLCGPLMAQQTETPPVPPVDYLKKSKRQYTTGYILTGTGFAGVIGTLVVQVTRTTGEAFVTVITLGYYQPDPPNYAPYYLASTAVLGAGIIYLVSAGQNKKKALRTTTSLILEEAPALTGQQLAPRQYPALALRVRLGSK